MFVVGLFVRRGSHEEEEPARLRMPMKRPEPVVEPVEVTPAEQSELDRLTRDLFGDDPAPNEDDRTPESADLAERLRADLAPGDADRP